MNFRSIQAMFASRKLDSAPKRILVVALFLVLLSPISLLGFKGASAVTQPNVVFSSPVNLSSDGNQAHYPWVVASGTNVYVAWTEQASGVYLKSSHNSGASFGPSVRLSQKGGTTNYPVMGINGSNVYVVWTQSLVSGGNSETFVTATNNNFASNVTVELSINQTTYSADTPYVATYGNTVYVLWHEVANSNGAQSVWVSSSSNSGQTWRTAIQLDAKSGQADEPQIAAWGTYAYVTWDRNGAWFTSTANSGATWSTPINLNSAKGIPSGLVREPWIAASGPNVYVTWNDNSGYGTTNTGSYDPYIMISNNNGLSWNQNFSPKGVKLNLMPSSTSSWETQVAAMGNSVYVAWRDHTPAYTTNGDVVMMMSSNAGLTWSPGLGTSPMDVSNDNQITGWSNGVGVSGSTVAVAYLSDCVVGLQEPSPNTGAGDCGMMVSYSNNGGQTFYSQVNVSNDRTAGPITDIASSNFAVVGSYVYVVWQDNAASNFQVYFSKTDGTVVTPSTFSTTPTKGAAGTTMITGTGGNFKPTSTITIKYDSTTVETLTSNSTGGFPVSFAVPLSAAGMHTISATDGIITMTTNFNVVPTVTNYTPVRGVSGTLVSLAGTGFAASSPMNVTLDGTTISTMASDSAGSFSTSVSITSTGGKHTIAVTDGTNSVSKSFTVVPKITITPKTKIHTQLPTSVTVTGSGFGSSTLVTIWFDGTNETTVTTSANGNFAATMFTVPSGTSVGSHTVMATDASNSATASFSVT